MENDAILATQDARLLERSGASCSIVRTLAAGRTASEREHWDLLLVDLLLPDGSGGDLIRSVARQNGQVGIVALSGALDLEATLDLHLLGAVLIQRDEVMDLVAIAQLGISRAMRFRGERRVKRSPSPVVTRSFASESFARSAGLSPRQQEAFELLVSGFAPKEIADQFGRSHVTVRRHIEEVCRKCGVTNQRELLALFARGMMNTVPELGATSQGAPKTPHFDDSIQAAP